MTNITTNKTTNTENIKDTPINSIVIGHFPRLFKSDTYLNKSYIVGSNVCERGGMKKLGDHVHLLGYSDHQIESTNPLITAYFLGGSSQSIAFADEVGLHKTVKDRIRSEGKAFVKGIETSKLTFASCGGMQHILKFCFGVDLIKNIPGKGQIINGILGKVDHSKDGLANYHSVNISDNDSIMKRVNTKYNKLYNKNDKKINVNSTHKRGFYKHQIDILNEDIKKTFDNKARFHFFVSSYADDDIVESVEIIESDTNRVLAVLNQFHMEYTTANQASESQYSNSPKVLNQEFDKVGNLVIDESRQLIVTQLKSKTNPETIKQVKLYIDKVKSQNKDIDSIKTHSIDEKMTLDIREGGTIR